MLHGWQLLQKRAELYKAVKSPDPASFHLDLAGFGEYPFNTRGLNLLLQP